MNRSAILSVRILGDSKSAVKGLNETSTAAGRMGSLVKAGAAIAATALVGLAAGGLKAVSMAGDLEQSAGAIDAVFKGSAGQMHDWSADAQTSVGLTKNEFNELGTLIGSQLKNGGTAMDELAPKTNNLIGLGADLSSMFGGDTRTAVEALSSALKGERDPIEKYGVSLNQTKIDAEAAALGFEKVGGALSAEANQAATLSLIMKQTTDAHGNFAKEAGTMQGQMQRANATWQNIVTTIGTLLLPVVTAFFVVINERVLPAVQSFVDGLGEGGLTGALGPLKAFFAEVSGGLTAMVAAFQDGEDHVTSSGLAGAFEAIGVVARNVFDAFGPIIGQVVEAFAPLIPQVMELASSFSPLSLIFQAITPLLPQIAELVGQVATTFGQLLTAVLPLATALAGAIVPVLTQLISAILPVLGQILGVISGLLPQLVPLFTMLGTAVVSVVAAIAPLVAQLVSAVLPIFGQLVATVLPLVVQALEAIIPAVLMVVSVLLAALMPVIKALLPIVTTVFNAVSTIITGVMQVVSGIIQVVLGVITGNWGSAWKGIQNVLSGVWNIIKGVVTGAVAVVRGVIAAALGVITGIWNGAWTAIKSYLSNAWSSITSAVHAGMDKVLGWFRTLPSDIRGFLSGLPGQLLRIGGDMMQGLINGIKNVGARIGGVIGNLVGGAINGAKKLLGIASPSKVFATMGGQIAQGMSVGIQSKEAQAVRAVEHMARRITSTGKSKLSGALDADLGSPAFSFRAGPAGNRSTAAPVTINVNVTAGVGDPVEIGREIDRVLTRYHRTVGTVAARG